LLARARPRLHRSFIEHGHFRSALFVGGQVDFSAGHWSIEDRLHWVRDTVYDEDRSQIRTHNGPE
ncbi:MAG TPA: hypothetical protein VKA77_17420, partial [Mycobacterium sp.]|nr:hypothetical protein [Mycobacterium sp.]